MRELIRIDLTKWGVDSGKEILFDGIDNVYAIIKPNVVSHVKLNADMSINMSSIKLLQFGLKVGLNNSIAFIYCGNFYNLHGRDLYMYNPKLNYTKFIKTIDKTFDSEITLVYVYDVPHLFYDNGDTCAYNLITGDTIIGRGIDDLLSKFIKIKDFDALSKITYNINYSVKIIHENCIIFDENIFGGHTLIFNPTNGNSESIGYNTYPQYLVNGKYFALEYISEHSMVIGILVLD